MSAARPHWRGRRRAEGASDLPERIRLGASAGEGHADAGGGFDDAGGELDQAQRAGLDARHHPACGLAPDLRGVARLGRAAQFD